MKNNKMVLVIVGCLIFLFFVLGVLFFMKTPVKDGEGFRNNIVIDNVYTELDKNEIQYQDDTSVGDLKEQTSMSGNDEIYEVQEEYDGRKVLSVKANLKYKVAFAGMITEKIPKLQELDKILEQFLPKYSGVWVDKNSRDKVVELFNGSEKSSSKYFVDGDGFLRISDKSLQTDFDKKIESAINGDRQFILSISSVCYIVDDVSGEILDYNFEIMDRYQIYEYFEDEDKCIVFVNENSYGQLSDLEMFESIVERLCINN